ncbi:subtilisin-like protease [Dioscorea cayenensis subsp. rotundata]|uniref:Subtilisin-like protease n=1 Tax=Dioscorea cayennensis subsp. rotundata TaxID=55577 RepID=A0AB40CV96_DIOCR|nr:subtilisin-like protease [Dioscorea cayenensis subsp. rotundata]
MGIIEDVLGKDDEFIFSIDFVIQDVDKDVEEMMHNKLFQESLNNPQEENTTPLHNKDEIGGLVIDNVDCNITANHVSFMDGPQMEVHLQRGGYYGRHKTSIQRWCAYYGYGNLLTSILDDQIDKKDSQHQTYIVHVRKPKHHELLSDEDVEHWHRSFLPNTTLDTGKPRLVYSYHHAISGFAARLTSEEVRAMESMEGFLMARPSRLVNLATTHTPSFLGLDRQTGLWPQSFMGSGVIIGVVDHGITPNHASFVDDGTMPPKPLKWKGTCGFHNKTLCNNKLIGAMAFSGSSRPSPEDTKVGHGSHVAGIAAGNFVDNADILGFDKGTASGIAPKAHLALYKVCHKTGCTTPNIVAAIEEAIKNGVDILNLSLGNLDHSPFYDDELVIATLSAVRAKIFVCICAGNTGPDPRSLWNNGAPWMLTVGASTHNRRFKASVKLGNAVEVEGEFGYQPRTFNATGNIVFPGFQGQNGTLGCYKTSFKNVEVKGKIVLCSNKGGYYKDLSINVKDAGGVGVIVLNRYYEGPTTFSDDHVVPTAHVNYSTALKIVNYFLNSSSTATATISFNGTIFGARPSPTVGSFSSRGPHAYNGGIIKPDILGPGVNIISAFPSKPGPFANVPPASSYFNTMSGTSMATPHLTGITALLMNTHKNWSIAAIRSAIMTTANRFDLDGNPILDDADMQINHANTSDMGSGQVNPLAANDPGLIYDINPDHYLQYLCGLGYNDTQLSIVAKSSLQCSIVGSIAPENLNYPSISISLDPSTTKSVHRTLTNVGDANELYNINVEEPYGISVAFSPTSVQFSSIGEEKNITLEFSSKGMPLNKGNVWDGQLKLDSGKHYVFLHNLRKFLFSTCVDLELKRTLYKRLRQVDLRETDSVEIRIEFDQNELMAGN